MQNFDIYLQEILYNSIYNHLCLKKKKSMASPGPFSWFHVPYLMADSVIFPAAVTLKLIPTCPDSEEKSRPCEPGLEC